MEFSEQIKRLSRLISNSQNILLICHLNPDGDAIGSLLALNNYLESIGKNVTMLSPNYLQEFLKWMNRSDEINIFIKSERKCKKYISEADLIIMVDFNHPDRLGEAKDRVLASGAKKVLIDHHRSPSHFVDLLISNPEKCAAAELIYDVVKALNVEYQNDSSTIIPFVNKDYAEAVYVGIVTDTGNFDFGSYTGHTLRIVADLLETGVDKERVRLNVFNNFSANRMRLMGFALDQKMVVMEQYKTAYISLSKEELLRYEHVKGDTEGFVNLPLEIGNVTFSILFIEKDDLVKLSFRSKGDFPVNVFATKYFSGGGHKNASGGEFYGSLDDAIAKFNAIIVNDNPSLCLP